MISLDPQPDPSEPRSRPVPDPDGTQSDGRIAGRPDFPILFAGLRDRISTLRSLYGAGPLAVDFRGLAERAGAGPYWPIAS